MQLTVASIHSPISPLIAISDNSFLYFLDFFDSPKLQKKIQTLQFKTNSTLIQGKTTISQLLEKELALYFEKSLTQFSVPIKMIGSAFQELAWKALLNIPYGQTRTYAEQASLIGHKNACRAVANANASNWISIIIPCHRIIQSNGQLGGYAGGPARKQQLLNIEEAAFFPYPISNHQNGFLF